jgi:urease accessory protein
MLGGVAILMLWPATAEGHAFPGAGDFYGGMLHPLVSLETLLSTIALGILAGQQGRDAAVRVLAAFPLAVLVGAGVSAARAGGPDPTLVTVGAMVVLGVLAAAARTVPRGAMIALAAVLGCAIGLANGGEMGVGTVAWRFVPGVVLSGLLVISYTLGYVRWLSADWTRIAVRVAGSWIAAAGLMTMALLL